MKKAFIICLSLLLAVTAFVGCEDFEEDRFGIREDSTETEYIDTEAGLETDGDETVYAIETSDPEQTDETAFEETEEPIVEETTEFILEEITEIEDVTEEPEILCDIWDGSVATSFEGGKGTKKDPFVIASAEQFAFFAQTVNSKTQFTDKVYTLYCDIDLGGLEWTPIGTPDNRFSGIFDGNGHTIYNLKITVDDEHNTQTEFNYGWNRINVGLFGVCEGSVIKNLNISGADVTVKEMVDGKEQLFAGILMGQMYTVKELSNIRLTDAEITVDLAEDRDGANFIGGLCAIAQTDGGTEIREIQTEIRVDIKRGYGRANIIGGIVGDLEAFGNCYVKNCASYLSIDIGSKDCYMDGNDFGAFGRVGLDVQTFTFTNVFSKVTVNKENDFYNGFSAYDASALIGYGLHYKSTEGVRDGNYAFENIYGCVEQIDPDTGEVVINENLYSFPYGIICTEVNCIGCAVLPEDCGLDEDIWDLSDRSAPRLK